MQPSKRSRHQVNQKNSQADILDSNAESQDMAYYDVAGRNIKLGNVAILVANKVKIDMFEQL